MSAVDLMTPGEVAKAFKVDPKTVSRWAQAGRLPSLKTPGGIYRFHRADVEALLADPQVVPTFVPGDHGTVFRYEGGVKTGAVWGPAVEDDWFAIRRLAGSPHGMRRSLIWKAVPDGLGFRW